MSDPNPTPSDLEALIAREGLAKIAVSCAELLAPQLLAPEVAKQFLLEELEAASRGIAEAKAFVRSTGIPASVYRGSMANSRPEVEGPGGPQQTLIAWCLQLQGNPEIMVKFRIAVVEHIMRGHPLGQYAS